MVVRDDFPAGAAPPTEPPLLGRKCVELGPTGSAAPKRCFSTLQKPCAVPRRWRATKAGGPHSDGVKATHQSLRV